MNNLGDKETTWKVRNPASPPIPLGKSGWNVQVFLNVTHDFSTSEGNVIRETADFVFKTENLISISESRELIRKFEQMISIVTLGYFKFQKEKYHYDGENWNELIWEREDDFSLFTPLEKHKVFLDLSELELFRTCFYNWFNTSREMDISRWIFVSALSEIENQIARFLAFNQAFEILTRELISQNKLTKKELAAITDRISNSLRDICDKSQLDRIINLVRSSNKNSYRDSFDALISKLIQKYFPEFQDHAEKFAKFASDTRNSFIHMQEGKNMTLDTIFVNVVKLNGHLCFWYALCQLDLMGVKISNAHGVLYNNPNSSGLSLEEILRH